MNKRPRDRSLSASSDEIEPDDYGEAQKLILIEHITPPASEIVCRHPPHESIAFASYAEYERHYQAAHTNRCADCQRNFPTDRFLNLHISENHDSITAIKRDRGEKTFACFVEGCEKTCTSWQRRRAHLVDKHKFPREYDFLVVNDGIDGRTSMLRTDPWAGKPRTEPLETKTKGAAPGPSSTKVGIGASDVLPSKSSQDLSTAAEKPDIDMLTTSLSSLRFVPPKIRFGRQQAAFKTNHG